VTRLVNLKIELLKRGLTQRELSKVTNINEGVLSLIIRGRCIPTNAEKVLISDALKKPVSELFAEQ
jgi:transcriptional regulator with XRE-family HTH domain